MKRRTFLGGAMAVAVAGRAQAHWRQQSPIKIGMSMAQTGGLAGGGKASQLGIEVWRDDVNRQGWPARPQGRTHRSMTTSRAHRRRRRSTPSWSTSTRSTCCSRPTRPVPTAPLMPFVKQRGMLLMGNFSFQVNSKVGHDMWFNNAPWGPADSWASSFLDLGQKGGGKSMALLAADQEFAQNLALTARDVAKQRRPPDCRSTSPIRRTRWNSLPSSARSRPPSPTSSMSRPIRPTRPAFCVP